MIPHTAGAKSGEERLTPLAYLRRDDRLYVFAANPERPGNPAWYHYLWADPDVTIEVGTETFEANSRMLIGANPGFAEFQMRTSPIFPLIELSREPAPG